MKSLQLRPHHALCAQFFEGKGYSEAFVGHMRAILAALGGDGASVTLTGDCDAICSRCPNNRDGVCETDEKVKAIDRRAIEAMGLSFGETLPWRALSALAKEKILAAGTLSDVCRDCEWIGLCADAAARNGKGSARVCSVVFDLDGTLTDSGEGIRNSARYAFEKLGLPIPAETELRKMVGPPLSVGFSVLGVPNAQIDEAVRLYRERYNEGGGKYENRVYDGIEDCLKELKAAGMRLYVGTSKPEPLAKEILSEFGLAPYFDCIAGASWDGSRQNKDDVLAYLLSLVGGADGTVMVGDTHYDVRGAHARNLPCIGVTWGYGTREELQNAGADVLINTPEELLTILLSTENESEK